MDGRFWIQLVPVLLMAILIALWSRTPWLDDWLHSVMARGLFRVFSAETTSRHEAELIRDRRRKRTPGWLLAALVILAAGLVAWLARNF
jgi:hypothetical protein